MLNCFDTMYSYVINKQTKKGNGKGKKGWEEGKRKWKGNNRSWEQDDRFMGWQCDGETSGVRCPQIGVLLRLLNLAKLNSPRFSLLMC